MTMAEKWWSWPWHWETDQKLSWLWKQWSYMIMAGKLWSWTLGGKLKSWMIRLAGQWSWITSSSWRRHKFIMTPSQVHRDTIIPMFYFHPLRSLISGAGFEAWRTTSQLQSPFSRKLRGYQKFAQCDSPFDLSSTSMSAFSKNGGNGRHNIWGVFEICKLISHSQFCWLSLVEIILGWFIS